ncbi:MAG TPA: VOC family protein [bacterium]|jgi:catechol 2,3-dioxygenase-like lactoylglutathione lyase family enzyme
MKLRGILETCIYVDDLDAAKDFYSEVLGMEFYSRAGNRHVFMVCGNRMFLIFNPEETSGEGDVPSHGATGPGHVAFDVPSDELEQWIEHLNKNGVEIEADVKFGAGRSIYFRDPAGNSLEISSPLIWGLDE